MVGNRVISDMELLVEMMKGTKSSRKLQRKLGVHYNTINKIQRRLYKKGYLYKPNSRKYELTKEGRMAAIIYMRSKDFNDPFGIAKEFKMTCSSLLNSNTIVEDGARLVRYLIHTATLLLIYSIKRNLWRYFEEGEEEFYGKVLEDMNAVLRDLLRVIPKVGDTGFDELKNIEHDLLILRELKGLLPLYVKETKIIPLSRENMDRRDLKC